MSDRVIGIEQLSKRYRIGRAQAEYEGMRHAIERMVTSPWRWLRRRAPVPPTADFWALRDVTFDIRRGEVVGIIGRNGAGKSTLLKVLSRITEPTSGRVRLDGRVASLLEVGTGFHGELTGRENIFLNGAILGMTRAEIRQRFDAIVAFADIDAFLDTPVKRYSSGMYVRLAFAVAAHLEPDILIIDEVLAVGDAAFQEKCLGKMQDVSSRDGRTVLFVSHNTGALSSLCTRGIVLDRGVVQADTDIRTAVSRYLNTPSARTMTATGEITTPTILGVAVDEPALHRGDFELHLTFASPFPLRPPIGGVVVTDVHGTPIVGTNGRMHPDGYAGEPACSGTLVCRIPRLPLHSGQYRVSAFLSDRDHDYDAQLGIVTFHFVSPDFRADFQTPPVSAIGPLNLRASWRLAAADGVLASVGAPEHGVA